MTKTKIGVDTPKAEPRVGPKKPKAQYLGGKQIVKTSKRVIDGKEYQNVELADGTAKILSEQDLEVQVTNKQGELIH